MRRERVLREISKSGLYSLRKVLRFWWMRDSTPMTFLLSLLPKRFKRERVTHLLFADHREDTERYPSKDNLIKGNTRRVLVPYSARNPSIIFYYSNILLTWPTQPLTTRSSRRSRCSNASSRATTPPSSKTSPSTSSNSSKPTTPHSAP